MTKPRAQREFLIGVIGDFSGESLKKYSRSTLTPFRLKQFQTVTADTFDNLLKERNVVLELSLPAALNFGTEQSLTLRFRSLSDFTRSAISNQIPSLVKMKEYDRYLQSTMQAGEQLQDLDLSKLVTAFSEERVDSLVAELENRFNQKTSPTVQDANEIQSLIDSLLGELKDYPWMRQVASVSARDVFSQMLQKIMQEQLDFIFDHSCFKELLSAWCGLKYLLDQVRDETHVTVKILDVSRRELMKDAERAIEFDQSHFFKLVYSEAFDTPGATPFSLMVGDFEFGPESNDSDLLRSLSAVTASAFAPFIAAASPNMFGLERMTELHSLPALQSIFCAPRYVSWNRTRQVSDSRFTYLSLPRVHLSMAKELAEDPPLTSSNTSSCFACNPAYVLAAWLAAKQTTDGWCLPQAKGAAIHARELQLTKYRDRHGNFRYPASAEVGITNSESIAELKEFIQADELTHFGFLPVCQTSDQEICFLSLNSVAGPIEVQSAQQKWFNSLECLLPMAAIAQHVVKKLQGRRFSNDQEYLSFARLAIAEVVVPEPAGSEFRFPFESGDAEIRDQYGWTAFPRVRIILTLAAGTVDPAQTRKICVDLA